MSSNSENEKRIVWYDVIRDEETHVTRYLVKFQDGTTEEYTEGGRLLSAARYPLWLDYIKNLEAKRTDENSDATEKSEKEE